MARAKKFRLGAAGAAVLVVLVALILWVAPSRQTSSAQDGLRPTGPLISRGYTDAPAGTVLIAGMASAGDSIAELRIVEGQLVKRDEIIAVMSNYSVADVAVRTAEAELEKYKRLREAMLSGYRLSEIAQQEVVVKSKVDENKLKGLEVARSGRTPEMKQLDLAISDHELELARAKLRVMKESLATDLAQIDTDIQIASAKVEKTRTERENALVRSPLNGVVLQIFARQGERVVGNGFAKIVDMSKLRVFADLDEVHLGRVTVGGKVEVTFRGSTTTYRGKISRIAPSVKRMQRQEPDQGSSTDARVVQVEIELDDPASMPQVLGRETRVTFL
jgi:multidrug resistance efflux pump